MVLQKRVSFLERDLPHGIYLNFNQIYAFSHVPQKRVARGVYHKEQCDLKEFPQLRI
jgi:hypothetical protein